MPRNAKTFALLNHRIPALSILPFVGRNSPATSLGNRVEEVSPLIDCIAILKSLELAILLSFAKQGRVCWSVPICRGCTFQPQSNVGLRRV